MTDTVLETELQERTSAPRVTPADVEAAIGCVEYFHSGTLTICVITLNNGFTVTGEMGCADPKNYVKDIGERYALEKAKDKIWPLLGYQLKEKLSLIGSATAPSLPNMLTYVGTKVVHATPMDRATYNILRGWELPADENGDDEGYLVEYADGGKANFEGFTGYVSWSPRDVFEKAYTTGKQTTFQERLIEEAKQLQLKLDKLQAFMNTEKFDDLGIDDVLDLESQFRIMSVYRAILQRRIDRL